MKMFVDEQLTDRIYFKENIEFFLMNQIIIGKLMVKNLCKLLLLGQEIPYKNFNRQSI